MRRAPSASYSITIRVRIDNKVGMIGEVISAIICAGSDVGAIDIADATGAHVIRDITVNAASVERSQEIVDHVVELPGAKSSMFRTARFCCASAARSNREQGVVEDSSRSFDGLHARRGARLYSDPRRSRKAICAWRCRPNDRLSLRLRRAIAFERIEFPISQ